MRRRILLLALAAAVLFGSPRDAGAEINEWCAGSWLGDDTHMPGDWDWDHMDGNDIYLRWAASQYIGHVTNQWGKGLHQLAWVGARNASGVRELNIARVMDFDPDCLPLRGSELTVSWVNDVNWVHHGGFVPQGHAEGAWYSPHGYLVWSGAGDETNEPLLAVARPCRSRRAATATSSTRPTTTTPARGSP
jgi:hypothetical protein